MRYDVVVVGARVAGASTALLLARAGVRVALVDRGAFGSDTLSTHALMRAGVLQLKRWGLLGRVTATGAPPVRSTVFYYPGGESLRLDLSPRAGVEALYAPRRFVLDRLLVEAAADAGVDVRHRTRVTELSRDREGRVSGVRIVTGDGAEHALGARLTIGADGLRSLVASQTGAQVLRRGRRHGAVLLRYLTDLPTDGYEWAYGAGAAAGLIPTNDGATCLFVSTTPTRLRQLRRGGTDRAFDSLLGEAAPSFVERVARATPVERSLRGWQGAPGVVRQPHGPGWALVGDAAYFKDPITAHGMTDALRDAELLSERTIEVLGGGVEQATMAQYQRVRDLLSRDLFDVTESVAGYDWDQVSLRRQLRALSDSMAEEVAYLGRLPDRVA